MTKENIEGSTVMAIRVSSISCKVYRLMFRIYEIENNFLSFEKHNF